MILVKIIKRSKKKLLKQCASMKIQLQKLFKFTRTKIENLSEGTVGLMTNMLLPQTFHSLTLPPFLSPVFLSLKPSGNSIRTTKQEKTRRRNKTIIMAGTCAFSEIIEGDVYKYYSEGEWKVSSSGKTVSIVNPTTRKTQFKVQGKYKKFPPFLSQTSLTNHFCGVFFPKVFLALGF